MPIKIKYPKEFMAEAGRRNLIGIRVPKEYGGRDGQWQDDIIVAEEICVPGYIFGCAWALPVMWLPKRWCISATRNKRKIPAAYLQRRKYAAECLTEPRGGSDFFGATTIARSDGNDFILNGQKRFIVGGEGADYFLVYAKTDLEAPSSKSMTCFMVERDMGVKTEYLYNLMGSRGGGTARVIFDNVRVPKENIIGELNGASTVFNQMMIPERFGTASMTIGAARPALEIATDYSNRRKAFGTEIKNFEAVSFKIAEMVTKLDSARAMIYATALAIDSGTVKASRSRRMASIQNLLLNNAWMCQFCHAGNGAE
jgi:alkylation response protein AidB-like acyl-CoA dehydrogenase